MDYKFATSLSTPTLSCTSLQFGSRPTSELIRPFAMELNLQTTRMTAEIDGSIGWMTFNNPARHNALSLEMWQGIYEIIECFESHEDVRVVVMQGAGEKSFISGADITEFDKQRSNAEQAQSYGHASAQGARALANMTKPLIALIRGYCIGGGLATALHADVRFATPDSTFGIPAARLGLGYDYEGLAKLSRIVGPARARDILFSARFLTVEEAFECGIVQFVAERANIAAEVESYARKIAENAPLTVKAAKAAVNAFESQPDSKAIQEVAELVRDCFNSSDYKEGRRAFSQKRRPEFTGK